MANTTEMTLQQVMYHFAPDLLAHVIVSMYRPSLDEGQDAKAYDVIACAASDELIANCGPEDAFKELHNENASPACLFWFCRFVAKRES